MTNVIRLTLLGAALLATAGCKISTGIDLSDVDLCENQSQTVGSVSVSPTTLALTSGASSSINVTISNPAGGAMGFCGPPASWTSDDSAVATVVGSWAGGFVTGVAAGSATITISVGGKTAKVQVTVTNAAAAAAHNTRDTTRP